MQLGDSDSIHFSLVNCVDNSFLKLLSQENYNMPPEHLVQRVKRFEPRAEGSYAFTQGQRVPWELCRGRVCGGLPLSSDRGTQYKHFHLWFAKDHLR